MHPELAKMLDLRFFHDNGWSRRTCPGCKEPYWTKGGLQRCGDSTCVEYSFLGKGLTKKALGLAEMREAFKKYWEGKGHARVPRNPVVARWRDDLYLNIASIANYQPHVTSGEVPPPANPLVVSQPCIRLNDLANIGRSGRHFSCFEMMGHHAFNSSAWGEHYWTEECVAWGHGFLTDVLGLDEKAITYKESTWSGGGNAGPCVEVFAGGLEVATLVFMCLEEHEEGTFEIKGEKYRRMDLRIIDTGWGLERLAWASTGTPTAYDTVFPDAIKHIKGLATIPIADDARSKKLVEMHARVQGVLNLDVGTRLDKLRAAVVSRMAEHGVKTDVDELERVMAPIEAMYGLADHLRCLSFMVGDGIVPSNVKAGYLMRLMFRRAFRFQAELGIGVPLSELLAWNLKTLVPQFPAFKDAIPRAVEMADLEHARFIESRDRGVRLVERTLQKKKQLSVDDLVEFYDTHGLGPHAVAEAAAKAGVKVDVPDTFDAMVAERHSREKKAKAQRLVPADTPATKRVFYDEAGQSTMSFSAKVTWTGAAPAEAVATRTTSPPLDAAAAAKKEVHLATFDVSCFFHDTGGQPGDRGHIMVDGKRIDVLATIKDGDQPVHVLAGPVKAGAKVEGHVDAMLRLDHTRSHTATHIMNQSVRRVLGAHSWQAGTQKYADCARVDMTHYRRPTQDELDTIERLANAIIMEGRPVRRMWWKRHEAEARWGMQLLQGGIPKGTDVRVVEIGKATRRVADGALAPSDEVFDVEYCGGTHCASTAEVGAVRIYRTERVQDGVERFEYAAGLHAVARWQADAALLRGAAEAMDVSPHEAPNASRRIFAEWKERGKLLDEVRRQFAEVKAQAAAGAAEEVGGVRLIIEAGLEAGSLQKTATELVSRTQTVVLLGARDGDKARLLFARSADVDVDVGALLREAIPLIDGKGGGRPDFAQGGGSAPDRLDACLAAAAAKVRAALTP